MALTDHSDLAARFHESAFNQLIVEFMRQRPDLFNYATSRIGNNDKFCHQINVDPVYREMEFPLFTEVPLMPIPTLAPSAGMNYCFQLTDLKIDFRPESEITLPAELGSLSRQQFSLMGKVCGGVACEQSIFTNPERLKELEKAKAKLKRSSSGSIFLPFDLLHVNCFCLKLFAKLIIDRDTEFLRLKLIALELEDISPLGLENSIECYLQNVLNKVVFPQIQIALKDLVFNASDYFSISLAPISGDIPFNPDVSNNNLSVYLNIN